MQSAVERRQAILEILCERRHEIIDNLAFEFEVERRTIRRDIEVLSISYPIYTTKGTGGGVHVVDGYRIGKQYLTKEQKNLLEKLATRLTGEDFQTMQSILKNSASRPEETNESKSSTIGDGNAPGKSQSHAVGIGTEHEAKRVHQNCTAGCV